MEGLAVIGFVFGAVSLVGVEKLFKSLKQQGVLNENYREN